MRLRDLERLYEKELIVSIAEDAQGVGAIKAATVAENFDSLKEFLKAEKGEFRQIITRTKKQVLNDQQITSIIEKKKTIPKNLDVKQAWLFKLSQDFINSQVIMLNQLTLENIDMNPLLIEALDLRAPRDILSFVLYQTVTRSIVTAWGTCVEKMVKYVGCEDNDAKDKRLKGKNFDLKKCLGSEEYYIQIKSGPNTMNVGMVESLNETIAKLRKGKKAFLGMTYGRRDRISAQIMGNLKNPEKQTKVGRELWDFVAEEQGYYKKVLNVIPLATIGTLDKNFIQLMDQKLDTLVQEWETKFHGKNLPQILEYYL